MAQLREFTAGTTPQRRYLRCLRIDRTLCHARARPCATAPCSLGLSLLVATIVAVPHRAMDAAHVPGAMLLQALALHLECGSARSAHKHGVQPSQLKVIAAEICVAPNPAGACTRHTGKSSASARVQGVECGGQQLQNRVKALFAARLVLTAPCVVASPACERAQLLDPL